MQGDVVLGRIWRAALALGSARVLATGFAVAGAGAVSADYGSGALYQVEISSNPDGFGLWIWAELGPGQASDYQETDCIHMGNGHATDAAAHDSGSLSSWSVANGMLAMNGVHLINNNVTANVSVPVGPNVYGQVHAITLVVTSETAPFFPIGFPLTLPATGAVAP
jgi:hypothetical protein